MAKRAPAGKPGQFVESEVPPPVVVERPSPLRGAVSDPVSPDTWGGYGSNLDTGKDTGNMSYSHTEGEHQQQ